MLYEEMVEGRLGGHQLNKKLMLLVVKQLCSADLFPAFILELVKKKGVT